MNVGPGTDCADAQRRAVLDFNDAIAARELNTLGRLTTDDHAFIDSDGNVVAGRDAVLGAWRGFFDSFPGYWGVWTQVVSSGDELIAIGRSVCAIEPELDGPAIWTANVRGNKLSEWRIYEDTPENRIPLGIDHL